MAKPLPDRLPCSRCGELKTLPQLRLCLSLDELEKLGLTFEQALDQKAPVLLFYCESCLIAAGENPETIMSADEMDRAIQERVGVTEAGSVRPYKVKFGKTRPLVVQRLVNFLNEQDRQKKLLAEFKPPKKAKPN